MTDKAQSLFSEFDHGRSSRRQLLKALGIAMAIRPTSAFAQGVCGGAKAGAPECDPTPAKLPFEPTGWKTVHLDISCQVADYPKEAAFYAALMNWKIRSGDGNQAVLDIDDRCRLILRGGYQVASPPSAGGAAAPAPRQGEFDSLCWGIEPWDAKKVEGELSKRGLMPTADNHKDFESFQVKDPDGFNVQISNGRRDNRRQRPANGKTSASAPFESTNWNTVWLDHISFEVSNYKETVAFYTALLGWKPGIDEGSQNQCEIGDIGDITIRRRRGRQSGTMLSAPSERGVVISHISFGISPFDPDQVKAELEKRGLIAKEDTGGKGDIHTALYKSFHTVTPNGFNLQISAATKATRILSSLD
jgi:catechol 2,3-dioxygenase-like lactoylglutathione lyase family enzyme